MMRSHTCPKCQGTMVEGVVLAERQGMRAVSTWAEGAPSRGWFGLKLNARPVEIKTWRCQRCGFLGSYARD